MDRVTDFRRVFADVVAARGGCRNSAIRDAFARVPRHEFLGLGPWQMTERGDLTSSDDPALVYQDVGLALARGLPVPNGLPSLHAECMEACAIPRGARLVHVGAGSGYYTAILAELVGPDGRVLAFEVDPVLGSRARDNLKAWPWVDLQIRSGTNLVEKADRIYVSAGVEALPLAWPRALLPGGKLILPLAPAPLESATGAKLVEAGGMLLVSDAGSPSRLTAAIFRRVQFVPCVGTEDAALRVRLIDAFRSGTSNRVRSLGLGPEPPDGIWLSGDGWWLSMDPA